MAMDAVTRQPLEVVLQHLVYMQDLKKRYDNRKQSH